MDLVEFKQMIKDKVENEELEPAEVKHLCMSAALVSSLAHSSIIYDTAAPSV